MTRVGGEAPVAEIADLLDAVVVADLWKAEPGAEGGGGVRLAPTHSEFDVVVLFRRSFIAPSATVPLPEPSTWDASR